MKRTTLKFVVLSKKDTEQDGFPRNLHFPPPFLVGTAFFRLSIPTRVRAFAKTPPPFAILRPERGKMPTL
jgi:hypothetical protein